MNKQTVFLLLACLGLVSWVASQGMATYCGRRLSLVLDYLCEGRLIKRATLLPSGMAPAWAVPTLSHRWGSRHTRQVVAECCDKPCSVEELMTYCGN